MAQQGETGDPVARLREALASHALAISALVARVCDLILSWRQQAAEQRNLASLSDRDLRDLGLSREDFAREPTQSLWRQ